MTRLGILTDLEARSIYRVGSTDRIGSTDKVGNTDRAGSWEYRQGGEY